MKSVALFSVKGGVGKSACAVNLAYVAAVHGGRRTLLWDLDAQGASTFTLRLQPKARARDVFAGEAAFHDVILASDFPNLDVLPADKSLRRLEGDLVTAKGKQVRKMLKLLEQNYDRVIIDCPPGLSELAERLFKAVDLIVSPLLPSPLSERALEQLLERLKRDHKGRPPVLPVWSMADRRKALHRERLSSVPGRPCISYSSEIERMAARQAPIGATAPNSAAARSFADLWRQVEAQLLAE